MFNNNKVTDRDYLFMSSMLKAREANMLTRDRLERVLATGDAAEAAKMLAEAGWPNMAGLNAPGIDDALSERWAALVDELEKMVPEKAVTEVFRLKYDYHNAKAVVKGEGARVDASGILSAAGRVSPEALTEAFHGDDYRSIPEALGKAVAEAKGVLARTENPQLADFVLDKAYYAEMGVLAAGVQDGFLGDYVRTLIDSANLRTCVRCARMGKNQDFLKSALIDGGNFAVDRMLQAASSADGIAQYFGTSGFQKAAELGAEAVKGGAMTAFERECDNAVTQFICKAKMSGFGSPVVAAYLAAEETNTTAVRMVLTGLLAGIQTDRLKERLRETYA